MEPFGLENVVPISVPVFEVKDAVRSRPPFENVGVSSVSAVGEPECRRIGRDPTVVFCSGETARVFECEFPVILWSTRLFPCRRIVYIVCRRGFNFTAVYPKTRKRWFMAGNIFFFSASATHGACELFGAAFTL